VAKSLDELNRHLKILMKISFAQAILLAAEQLVLYT